MDQLQQVWGLDVHQVLRRRQIGNAFEELQRKVMRDDIMRLRKNGEDLFNQDSTLKQKRVPPGSNNEYDLMLNNMDDTGDDMFTEPKSKFRQMYEMKKQKIKATYEYNIDDSNHISHDSEHQNQDGPQNKNYNYITENHHHHHHYYGTNESDQENNNNEDEEQIDGDNRDNQMYQSKEKGKQKSQNNRYQNEDDQDYNDEQTDDIETTEVDQTGLRGVDTMKKKHKSKSSSQQREIAPIYETNESFEISPEKIPIYQQIDIIKPTKLVKSYLQQEALISKGKLGLIVKSAKQLNAVEMSFSDNPFEKRLSQFGYANNQSTHNQSSPDFKARDPTSYTNNQKRQFSHQNLKSETLEPKRQNNFQQSNNDHSLSKISEMSSEQQNVNPNKDNKQKFSEKLKNLMSEFEIVKGQQFNSQFSDENISSIENLNFIQDNDMSKYNNNSKNYEEKKGDSKIKMLQRRIVHKDQQQMQQPEPVLEGIETPLGMMYKVSPNTVLFEEKRITPQNVNTTKTFTVQSKKNMVQSKQKEDTDLQSNIFERQSEAQQSFENKIESDPEPLAQVNNERLNEAGQKLYLIVKQKQMIMFKQTFDQIKQFTILIKKQIIDQFRKRSVQKIALYLQNKERRLLNKKFQKYRKCSFLNTFNMKLVALSQLINKKVAHQKKEAFKEIIGICLKNQGFKQQIEQLNYENENQKQKVMQLQLTLLAKVSKNSLLKYGFKAIQIHSANKNQQQLSIKKIEQILKQRRIRVLNDSVALIKQRAIFMTKLKNCLLKHQQKISKRSLNDFIQRWKQEVYRRKLIKVNLQILVKAYQGRIKQSQNKYFQRWRAFKQLMIQKSQVDGAKLIKRIGKTIDKKSKQKALITWRLNSQTQNANLVKNEMVKQFQNRMLRGLANKIKTILIRDGFLKLKSNFENQVKFSQEKRVTVAISLIASATKICQIIENKRIDRVYFQYWKNLIQKQQQIMLGSQILSVVHNKRLSNEFGYFKSQLHLIQIQKTKKQISLNIIKVLLYKLYKEQMQRAFNNWMLQDSRNRLNFNNSSNGQKPPKQNTTNNIQDVPSTITITRIFGQHSRANSANNSVMNQSNSGRNMRYSNQGDDDYDNYEDYDLYTKKKQSPKTTLNNAPKGFQRHSSVDIIITSSDPSQTSSHQLQNSSSACSLKIVNQSISSSHKNNDISKTKNQVNQRYHNKSQNSVHSFLDNEKYQNSQISPKFGKIEGSVKFFEENDFQDAISDNIDQIEQTNLAQDEQSQNSDKITSQQLNQLQMYNKGSSNRNKSQNLNKFLNNNKTNSSNTSNKAKTKVSTIKNQITPKTNSQQYQAFDQNMNQRSTFQSNKSNSEFSNQDKLSRQDIESDDNLEEKYLIKSSSLSKIVSPKSQTTLEPVPEETYQKKRKSPRKLQTKQQSQKSQRANSNTSKLSQFFSQNIAATSNTQTNNKEKKEKSRENQQKYKVFLMNAQNKQKNSPIKKSAQKQQDKQDPNQYDQVKMSHAIIKQENNNKRIQRGLENLQYILEQKVYRKTFEHIITTVFDYDFQDVYLERKNKRKAHQLQRILQLRAKILNKRQFLLWEAFALWKRLDYISMLNSLQQFKDSLNSIYNVSM